MAYTTVTAQALLEALDDRYEEVPFWERDEALAALNEGLRVWNFLTGRWKHTITFPTVVGDQDYVLPASLVYRMRVTCDGRPLMPTGLFALDQGRPGWRLDTTASGGSVPTRPVLWVPVDLRRISLWPIDATGGRTLVVDGVSQTPVLTEEVGSVDLGEETFTVLLNYALHVLAFKKAGPFFAATLPYYQAFLRAAAEENSQIKASQAFRRAAGLEERDTKRQRGAPTLLQEIGRD